MKPQLVDRNLKPKCDRYYHETFDGTSFNAKIQFLAKQEVLGTIPFYADSPIIEGQIQFEFTIELEVD